MLTRVVPSWTVSALIALGFVCQSVSLHYPDILPDVMVAIGGYISFNLLPYVLLLPIYGSTDNRALAELIILSICVVLAIAGRWVLPVRLTIVGFAAVILLWIAGSELAIYLYLELWPRLRASAV